jgi:hypothetical protein
MIQRRLGADANLFDLDDLLALFRFAFLFRPFVLVLAIVQNTADGRIGVGGNLYEV